MNQAEGALKLERANMVARTESIKESVEDCAAELVKQRERLNGAEKALNDFDTWLIERGITL